MKILFVSDVSIRNIEGGANRVLFEETTRLALRGHDVCILTRKLPEMLPEEETIDGVKEYRYEIDSRNSFTFSFSTIRNSKKLFEAVIEKTPFHLINFHQPFSAFGILRSRKSRHVQKVYTCHSLAFEEYETRHPDPKGMLSRVFFRLHSEGRKRIERYAIRKCPVIVTLSDFMKEKVVTNHGIPPDRIHIIPGGVDHERFHSRLDKRRLREELKIDSDRFVLLTVRNLVPRMGLDNLILAMENVVKEAKDILLVIGGEGSLRKPLEALVKERALSEHVVFTGYIAESELPAYYQAADLFMLPTLCLEGFGLVTLEALASGTPVLGTPVGATPEILEKLDKTLLSKDAAPSSIADLIIEKYRQFKKNPDQYYDLSHRCRKYVEDHYTWERHVERVEELFKDALSEH